MTQASFRFHGALERFLAPTRRGRVIRVECAAVASVKHQIEALGVPHTEVGLLLINGEAAALTQRLDDGDEVIVHPAQAESSGESAPGHPGAGRPRFVADAHLGALARRLRMAGFDTLYDNAYADPLTRDRELLKRRQVLHGCYVHALRPEAQLQELYQRLGLRPWALPFSRCLACNSSLQAVSLAEVADRLPPRVRELHCAHCDKLFWEGSHWRAMRERLALV